MRASARVGRYYLELLHRRASHATVLNDDIAGYMSLQGSLLALLDPDKHTYCLRAWISLTFVHC